MTQIFLTQRAQLVHRSDGALVYSLPYPLPPCVARTGDRLDHWAMQTPDVTFLAERCGVGWKAVSYRAALEQVRALASALLGMIGVPLLGLSVKLIPTTDGVHEIRVMGPNVTKGFFNAPDKTTEAFDEEGYLITGDAVRFVDENNPDDDHQKYRRSSIGIPLDCFALLDRASHTKY